MANKFLFAGAGTGKTERVVSDAIELIRSGKRVLVLTYTTSNQREIYDRFVLKFGARSDFFSVKGIFSFYLEDLIRPYQRVMFPDRIGEVLFNQTDPHKTKNGRNIPGRKEKVGDKYNPDFYLTKDRGSAHSTYLAKLVCAISKEAKGAPLRRLEALYDHVFVDECQDLVGWDYEVLALLVKSKTITTTCVGDFRQTIYQTARTSKKPGTMTEKVEALRKLKFDEEKLDESRRSVQSICDFAGKVHEGAGFPPLTSNVMAPPEESHHVGVFVVKESDARRYFELFQPVVLRNSVASGKQYDDIPLKRVTFGDSKGLGFARVAIIPTEPQLNFLMGNAKAFDEGKTETSKNRCYVAFTRAKYSLAIIVADDRAAQCNILPWECP